VHGLVVHERRVDRTELAHVPVLHGK